MVAMNQNVLCAQRVSKYLSLFANENDLCYFHLINLGLGRKATDPPLVTGWFPYIEDHYVFWKDPITYLNEARKKHGA